MFQLVSGTFQQQIVAHLQDTSRDDAVVGHQPMIATARNAHNILAMYNLKRFCTNIIIPRLCVSLHELHPVSVPLVDENDDQSHTPFLSVCLSICTSKFESSENVISSFSYCLVPDLFLSSSPFLQTLPHKYCTQ